MKSLEFIAIYLQCLINKPLMLKFPQLKEALFEERPNSQVPPRPDIKTGKLSAQ